MDFIDEEDVAFAEIRQSTNEVAGFLEGGAGGASDVDTQFPRDELSESSLAQPRWTEEQDVIQRLSATERSIYIDAQGFLDAILADELGQALRAERELDYTLVRNDLRRRDLGSGHSQQSTRRQPENRY